ncbi:hypothetical protein DFH07DRAFT_940524 [Mycena maculata]|uniref:F-box domain-containing protein n=1 Tax=Mycena maculata TaxID=230809 RepID=A0AAD7NF56_9AGAR|nr:hypothetical protein DFH07DRAFT_940524 [Mycena maculata]
MCRSGIGNLWFAYQRQGAGGRTITQEKSDQGFPSPSPPQSTTSRAAGGITCGRSPLGIQELVDYCIDFLHASHPDLKACSLVSRSWTPTAQMHLFRHICIDQTPFSTNDPSVDSNTLKALADRWPCLCEVLVSSARHRRWIEVIEICPQTTPRDILITLSKLPLPGIRRINIMGPDWTHSPASLINAAQKLLRHPTLTGITLFGEFESPWDSWRSWSTAPQTSKPSLSVPSICGKSPQSHTCLALNERNRALDVLTLSVLAPAIPRIESLSVELQSTHPTSISLASFTNLKCLELIVLLADAARVLDILPTLPRPNRIETIQFYADDTTFPGPQSGPEIDRQIVTAHLKAVELIYYTSTHTLDLAECFPLLNSRGLVRVRYPRSRYGDLIVG